MASTDPEIAYEFLPFLRIHKNGHVERLRGTQTLPSGFDPQTAVTSKDITIIPNTEVYARLYLPPNLDHNDQKLPLLVYYHGGGFCLSTADSANYHNYLNKVVAKARVVAVSVNYRKSPEFPLPVAYEDSWAALQWVASHRNSDGPDAWLNDHADFGRFFVAGVSAGANIAHNLALLAGKDDSSLGVEILGVVLEHPFFWGSEPVGSEGLDLDHRAYVDQLWPVVCPSSPDSDDPRLNPVAVGAPSLAGLGCGRVLVSVAEKDFLRDRGWLYYQALGRSGWKGVGEIHESEGEDHGFHVNNWDCEKAKDLIERLATFYNSV